MDILCKHPLNAHFVPLAIGTQAISLCIETWLSQQHKGVNQELGDLSVL